MKYLSLLVILFLSINSWGQDSVPKKLINIEDYNPQAPITEPIGIVDKFGSVEWKYPEKPKENPQAAKEVVEEKKEEPIKEKFIKAPNTGKFIEVNGSGLGYFNGVSLLGGYQNNRWSFGGSARYYMYSGLDGISFNSILVTGFAQYHFLPRWYTNSPSHKKLDLGISANLGYGLVEEKEGVEVKSTPVLGVGLFSSYPLADHVRVTGRAEVFQGISGFKPFGSSISVGISFDF